MDKNKLFSRLVRFFKDDASTMEDETFCNFAFNLGFTEEELNYLGFDSDYLEAIGFLKPKSQDEELSRLAHEIDQLAYDFDPYDYTDQHATREEGYNEIFSQLKTGHYICHCPKCGKPVLYQGDWGFDDAEKQPYCTNCGEILNLPEGY